MTDKTKADTKAAKLALRIRRQERKRKAMDKLIEKGRKGLVLSGMHLWLRKATK